MFASRSPFRSLGTIGPRRCLWRGAGIKRNEDAGEANQMPAAVAPSQHTVSARTSWEYSFRCERCDQRRRGTDSPVPTTIRIRRSTRSDRRVSADANPVSRKAKTS